VSGAPPSPRRTRAPLRAARQASAGPRSVCAPARAPDVAPSRPAHTRGPAAQPRPGAERAARGAQAYGIDLGTRMCRALLDHGVPGVHLYTLNLEASALAILENLGLVNKAQARPGC